MFEDLDFARRERVINKFINQLSVKKDEMKKLEDECVEALFKWEQGKATIDMLELKIKDLTIIHKSTIK